MEKYRCNIVGYDHHLGARATMQAMKENDLVCIRRDPTNKYDHNAIRVETSEGKMLGFIPASQAREIAPRMDCNKMTDCFVPFHVGRKSFQWSVSIEV